MRWIRPREAVTINVIAFGEGSVSVDRVTVGLCRLRAVGAFDMSNRGILDEAICTAARASPKIIEIDLGDVRFIDAGVVRVLMERRAALAADGCVLRVVDATGLPAMVLDLTRTRNELCG
ncbi:STAS domain-containing protein [Virgisporangium aurantiacum]|uniref:STAS domain-containing protein n=1 Tax=Virgisporangium aurantiacum TaxID=175570 RepID=UPI0019500C86|nr:STAS domain-containing protein [Virgisporangium aurantiacum]